MDIETFFANLAVLSFVIVPYFAFIYIGHKQYNEVGKRFQQETKKHGLHIDEYERWNRNALGIDYKQQKLLLVVKRDEIMLAEVISLANIKECVVVPCTHPVKTGTKKTEELDKIFLELTPFEGTDRILVSLFDSEYTFEQDYEMKHAEKWNKLINSSLMAPAKRKRSA